MIQKSFKTYQFLIILLPKAKNNLDHQKIIQTNPEITNYPKKVRSIIELS